MLRPAGGEHQTHVADAVKALASAPGLRGHRPRGEPPTARDSPPHIRLRPLRSGALRCGLRPWLGEAGSRLDPDPIGARLPPDPPDERPDPAALGARLLAPVTYPSRGSPRPPRRAGA